ncbi:hypothetical protein PDIG_42150 [Penicillium digitatum PHI26]|uniref:Uncharacterized protein n=1 Tax=Penicillium digitatum (strain PHI26 / CECT 20796) TaxID=1170229 RepID=K9FUH0_PEND2|nr:hypothetical protein PDIG_42150 [Penicillium digitatum PHI26]
MFSENDLQKALQERIARAASRGFTREYQNEKEDEDNTICHRELAPATLEKYDYAVVTWALWRLSRDESTDSNFPNLPVPTPQLLKLFADFTSRWERDTSRPLSDEVKQDVLNRAVPCQRKGHRLPASTPVCGRLSQLCTRESTEHPVLGKSFVFWVIVHGVADGAFKGHTTVTEVLAAKPPKGRESWTLEWNETAKDLPFFRMLRVHGIRGGIANKIDRNMSHHRDSNVPLQLNAATIEKFQTDDEIVEMNQRIAHMTQEIAGGLEENRDLVFERARLYSKKAKRLLAWKKDFVKNWWDTSYAEYVSGNDFSERDSTPLFDIYKKYLPERSRLSENLLKKATLDSEIGRQCLEDMVTICTSTERTVYYPGMAPEEGCCPICNKSILE